MTINGIDWKIIFVEPNNKNLINNNGTYTLGCTNGITNTIYLNNRLSEYMTRKVLTHEIVHAICFSYGILFDIHTEELIADFMANYGFEVIMLVENWMQKLSLIV